MTAKKRGGRVTPKGTQPPSSSKGKAGSSDSHAPRAAPGRVAPAPGRPSSGPIGPTRSGHHRGNR